MQSSSTASIKRWRGGGVTSPFAASNARVMERIIRPPGEVLGRLHADPTYFFGEAVENIREDFFCIPQIRT
jgi:hypothetical protein